jgi:hypothetical protein
MRKNVWIIILACSCAFACRHGAADQPLSIQDMKLVMWDLMKADEWYLMKTLKDSTVKKQKENIRLFEQVFYIHGITKDRFYNSYRYYEAHPLQMKVLFDSVDQFSSRERNRISENHGQAKPI